MLESLQCLAMTYLFTNINVVINRNENVSTGSSRERIQYTVTSIDLLKLYYDLQNWLDILYHESMIEDKAKNLRYNIRFTSLGYQSKYQILPKLIDLLID